MFKVTIKTNIPEYRKTLKRKMELLVKSKDKSSLTAAKYMVLKAKQFAPKYTGETINGIRRRKLKSGQYTVTSTVSPKGDKGFMQNMWANQTFPHRSPKMVWNRGPVGKPQPTVYGDGSHNVTGKPRFFHFAILETNKRFHKLARVNAVNALRVKV